MIRLLVIVLFTVTISGCATSYYFEGKKYDNQKAFQAAVDESYAEAMRQIQPLLSPLTKKKLIVAIPSKDALYAEMARRYMNTEGKELTGIGIEQAQNMSKASNKLSVVFYEAIRKRGIYPEVVINETSTMVNSLEPSAEYDVIYYTEPGVGAGQLFYASSKHGKQIFAYDRSDPGVSAKVKAFVDAAQSMAVRE